MTLESRLERLEGALTPAPSSRHHLIFMNEGEDQKLALQEYERKNQLKVGENDDVVYLKFIGPRYGTNVKNDYQEPVRQ